MIWARNSPNWRFDDAMLDRAAHAFDNDDYVDIVIHSYRHRLGLAPGYAPYDDIEKRLADQPAITVPTITLDGQADGNFLHGTASAAHFTGLRTHRRVPNAGHNLPQEAPEAFAEAVLGLPTLNGGGKKRIAGHCPQRLGRRAIGSLRSTWLNGAVRVDQAVHRQHVLETRAAPEALDRRGSIA